MAVHHRIPLKDGTVLRTVDGKSFHILHSTSIGGSALLYSAHLDGSALDVTLKEFCPVGCTRVNGVALDSRLATLDASPELQQKFYERLHEQAHYELTQSQLAYNGSFHALPHLEQLEICSISQPGEPVCEAADGTALPCAFLYLPTLNPAKGFFLSELVDECTYPQSKEHPFGALDPNKPAVVAAPHVLTTLRLIRLILEALETLHKTAIHGDISLGNLFIDGDLSSGALRGAVFLDFGSARLLDAPGGKTAPIPPSENIYTTPLFCAPEIFTGANSGEPFCLTPAADVYSVGVLLRFLLRKEALAAYRTFPEDLAEELKPTQIYPSDTVPSAQPLLPQLNRILSAAAEPDPEKRITTAKMLEAVNELIEQLSAPHFPLKESLSSPDVFLPKSRDEELKLIQAQMEAGVRPIFIYGLGGLGKTETARAFLRKCKQNGRHVAFFNYEQSVRNTILNLEFTGYTYTPSRPNLTSQQQEEEQYHEKLKLLAAMGPDSVVVMDNFDSSTQTLDQLRSEPAYHDLIDLGGPRLIITTRFTPKGNPPVEIRPLPEKLLLKMMLDLMGEGNDSPSVDTLLHIIEAVQGHTLTCYLIGNALSDPLGDLTAQDILDALNQYNLHSLTEDVTSDKDRKYTTETIYGHLKLLFDLCGMTGAYRSALCHTLLLPQKGLDIKLFRQGESKEEQDALRSLIAHGWVQCACLKEGIHLLTIHPLIRELILNEMRPKEEDILPYTNRLWERYDPWDFTAEELRLRISLLENALDFFQPDSEWAELHYRLGILYLMMNDQIPPSKENLILDLRDVIKRTYSNKFDPNEEESDIHKSRGWHFQQAAEFESNDPVESYRYYSSYIFWQMIDCVWHENTTLTALNFLRKLNKSSCQSQDKKNDNGFFNTIYLFQEIQTFIIQNSAVTDWQKTFCNNLACACMSEIEKLLYYGEVVRESSSFYHEDFLSKNEPDSNIFDSYTKGYTKADVNEIKQAPFLFENLPLQLLKMAESQNDEIQIAVLENLGYFYTITLDESSAQKYYLKSFETAQKCVQTHHAPWLPYLHSRMGESHSKLFKKTEKTDYIDAAIQDYQNTYQLYPIFSYQEAASECMVKRAVAIYKKDPQQGHIEADKVLDYWEQFVSRIERTAKPSELDEVYRRSYCLYRDVSYSPFSETINLERSIHYSEREIYFLKKEFNLQKNKSKETQVFFYKELRTAYQHLYYRTKNKESLTIAFEYWKKAIDIDMETYGMAQAYIRGTGADALNLADELSKVGLLEEADIYYKKFHAIRSAFIKHCIKKSNK